MGGLEQVGVINVNGLLVVVVVIAVVTGRHSILLTHTLRGTNVQHNVGVLYVVIICYQGNS
jgi:hypothetical protein